MPGNFENKGLKFVPCWSRYRHTAYFIRIVIPPYTLQVPNKILLALSSLGYAIHTQWSHYIMLKRVMSDFVS